MRTPDIERFHRKLTNLGLKITPQRTAVHLAMISLVHANAEMVAQQIKQEGTVKVSTPSIYNILNELADCGVYARRMSRNNRMYFDLITKKHVHLYDTKHNEFKDIADDEVIKLVETYFKGRRWRGYKLDGVEIQLICHSTRRKIEK